MKTGLPLAVEVGELLVEPVVEEEEVPD